MSAIVFGLKVVPERDSGSKNSLDIWISLVDPLQVTERDLYRRQLSTGHSALKLIDRSLFQREAIALGHREACGIVIRGITQERELVRERSRQSLRVDKFSSIDNGWDIFFSRVW